MDIEKLKHKYPKAPQPAPSTAQPAGKHFDMVMGLDIHIVTLPIGPTPIPHPHVGMVFDVMDLIPPITIPVSPAFAAKLGSVMEKAAPLMGNMFGAGESSAFHKAKDGAEEAQEEAPPPEEGGEGGDSPPETIDMPIGIGSSVMINGVRRSHVSTESTVLPMHFPLGGPFVMPTMVKHKGRSFMGSKTVLVEGMPATYNALPFMSCSCIGATFAPNPKKGGKPGLFLPTATIMPIPMGMPVNIGGPPTIFLSPLGAALKGFKFFRKWQKGSKFWKKISDKLHGKGKNKFVSKLICLATGHPVDVADGKLFTDWVDFEIAGPIPMEWERTYYSASPYQGPLGTGWRHSFDIHLDDDPVEAGLVLQNQEGRHILLPRLQAGERYYDRGEKLHFFHDGNEYVVRLSSGLEWRFFPRHERIFKLREIRNDGGHKLQFQYDLKHRLIGIADSAGREIQIENDDHGRIIRIVGPSPNKIGEQSLLVEYQYDQEGRLTEVSDALGQPMRFAYRGSLLTRETWRNGLNFHFRYDGHDHTARCIHTWGDGGIYDHKLDFHDEEGYTEVTNSLGHITRHYHHAGMVYRSVFPNGAETITEYNQFNEVLSETDALGRTTAYTYDILGNQTGIITPTGGKVAFAYDGLNRLIAATDINGLNWEWEYGNSGLLEKIHTPTGTTEYSYENGLPVKILENNIPTVIDWDASLNPIRISINEENEEFLRFDHRGRLLEKRDNRRNLYAYTYDELDRVVQVRNPDGITERLEYDAQDNLVRMRNGRQDIRYEYRGMQRMTAREENGRRVEFFYNTEEDLIAIRNEKGANYNFRLDTQGQVTTESGFGGLLRKYQRDIHGRVSEVLAPGGKSTRYHYDGGDRVRLIEHYDGTTESFTYGEDGRLLEAANEHCLVKFEYDQAGRVKREVRDGYEVSSRYDYRGKRTRVQSNLGADIRIGYDPFGDVTSTNAQNGHVHWETRINRDHFGLEVERQLPGGITTRWKRDRMGRPIELNVQNGAGKFLRKRQYSWVGEDRISAIADFKKGYEVRYHHDVWGNLVHAVHADGTHDVRHTDETGNLYRTFEENDRKYGDAGELLQCQEFSYKYDAEGFLVEKFGRRSGERWKYSWNASGMLREVVRPDGKRVRMEYDPLGRRIAKYYDGKVTRWIWDGNLILHEWEAEEAAPLVETGENGEIEAILPTKLVTWVFEGGTFSPAAKLVNGERYSIVCDHLGTPNQAYDGRGNLVWECELDIYGKVRKLKGDRSLIPFRFPGQYEDGEIGLYYNRFRYYSPEIGGYVSQDPIGLEGGLSFHKYVNDPLFWIDFFGLQCHHIATNKHSLWSPRFRKLFKKYGVGKFKNGKWRKHILNDPRNKVFVKGHKGPHPNSMHQKIFDILSEAGESGGNKGFEKALSDLSSTAQKPGSWLNKILTGT